MTVEDERQMREEALMPPNHDREQRLAEIRREHGHARATTHGRNLGDSWLAGYDADVGWLLSELEQAEAERDAFRDEAAKRLAKLEVRCRGAEASLARERERAEALKVEMARDSNLLNAQAMELARERERADKLAEALERAHDLMVRPPRPVVHWQRSPQALIDIAKAALAGLRDERQEAEETT